MSEIEERKKKSLLKQFLKHKANKPLVTVTDCNKNEKKTTLHNTPILSSGSTQYHQTTINHTVMCLYNNVFRRFQNFKVPE